MVLASVGTLSMRKALVCCNAAVLLAALCGFLQRQSVEEPTLPGPTAWIVNASGSRRQDNEPSPRLSHLFSRLEAVTCDCSQPTPCVHATKNEEGARVFPGGGAKGLRGTSWGVTDPVAGVPRLDCGDTVTHAYHTYHQYRDDFGVEHKTAINRFYGSTIFPPHGPGGAFAGYSDAQSEDALCTGLSGALKQSDAMKEAGVKDRDQGCPDPCAYSLCNEGQVFTVQCPDNCFQAGTTVYGSPESGGVLGPYADFSSICRAAVLAGAGTNDDSFYTSFKIVKPVAEYRDPGGSYVSYPRWDWATDPGKVEQAHPEKCCRGGWPPRLGEYNPMAKWRQGFKNEWQNVRAFVFQDAVTDLCPKGFEFKPGRLPPTDPACRVDRTADAELTPAEGCDACVETANATEVCGMDVRGMHCDCTLQLAEARRKEEEERRKKEEERKRKEEEARRKKEEERKRKEEEERKRKEEEEEERKEEEAERKRKEEAERKRKEEAERKRKEEEERKRKEEEEERRRLKEEAEAAEREQREAEEAEKRRKAAALKALERKKREAEAAAARKREEAARAEEERLRREQERKKREEEQERVLREKAEEERRREEEARREERRKALAALERQKAAAAARERAQREAEARRAPEKEREKKREEGRPDVVGRIAERLRGLAREKEGYVEAAENMKLLEAPFKAARDAFVGAVSTAMEELFEAGGREKDKAAAQRTREPGHAGEGRGSRGRGPSHEPRHAEEGRSHGGEAEGGRGRGREGAEEIERKGHAVAAQARRLWQQLTGKGARRGHGGSAADSIAESILGWGTKSGVEGWDGNGHGKGAEGEGASVRRGGGGAVRKGGREAGGGGGERGAAQAALKWMREVERRNARRGAREAAVERAEAKEEDAARRREGKEEERREAEKAELRERERKEQARQSAGVGRLMRAEEEAESRLQRSGGWGLQEGPG